MLIVVFVFPDCGSHCCPDWLLLKLSLFTVRQRYYGGSSLVVFVNTIDVNTDAPLGCFVFPDCSSALFRSVVLCFDWLSRPRSPWLCLFPDCGSPVAD
jgi:hypothetical protein